jgi:ribosomal protein L11 methylase PrmA
MKTAIAAAKHILPAGLHCCLPVDAVALLMGASTAVGTDTDPLAVRAAEANAGLNGVQGRFSVVKCGANLNDADPMLEVSQ